MLWFVFQSGLIKEVKPSLKNLILTTLISLLVVGVAWEVFEYVFEITGTTNDYTFDTSVDLIFDLLGAFLASSIGREVYNLKD